MNNEISNTKDTAAKHRCDPRKVGRIVAAVIGGVVMAVVFAFVFGILVKLLWNWLMPLIFGLPQITYWQAFGILVLAKLLFGSFGHGHHGHSDHIHRNVDRRWHRYLGVKDEDDEGSHRHWKYYKQYWKDEGKAAFEEYVDKIEKEKKDD
jgi:hypothetical protein